jgi:biotin carboxylase
VLAPARELSLETVVLSYDRGDRRLPAILRRQIDRVVRVQTNDHRAVAAAVTALEAERPILGIIPGSEFHVPVAAQVANRLGLPGLPVAQIGRIRDKTPMLRRVREAGLRVPRHALVTCPEDLRTAADQVGFPCVVKPVASAGSVHVSRVDSASALHAAYRSLCIDRRRDLGWSAGDRMLVTEYLAGPEYSVEGYVHDGKVAIAAVTEKRLGPEPHFVEIGHIVQAPLDPRLRGDLENFTRRVVDALEITVGAFHCELRLVDGYAAFIEIGARLAGDRIVELVELATGVSLPRAMLAGHSGLALDRVGVERAPQAKFAGIRFLTAPAGQRTYRCVAGLDRVLSMDGVLEASVDVPPGEVIPPPEDFRCRLGHALFVADSYREASELWDLIGKVVRFVP